MGGGSNSLNIRAFLIQAIACLQILSLKYAFLSIGVNRGGVCHCVLFWFLVVVFLLLHAFFLYISFLLFWYHKQLWLQKDFSRTGINHGLEMAVRSCLAVSPRRIEDRDHVLAKWLFDINHWLTLENSWENAKGFGCTCLFPVWAKMMQSKCGCPLKNKDFF